MEVFEKLLDSELYSYFKNASFYENPVFHTAHKTVDFYIEFENKKIIISFSTRKVTQFHPAIPLSKISRRESYAFLSC